MLVVDDERAVLDGITAILSEDVDVQTCTSAEEALRMVGTGQFHLVCSDYRMPGMKGDELLRRVARMPFYTSCLLVTGADEYIRAKTDGNHYVIFKPFDPEKVIGLVLELARLAEMKRSVRSRPDAPPRGDLGGAPESSRVPPSLDATRLSTPSSARNAEVPSSGAPPAPGRRST